MEPSTSSAMFKQNSPTTQKRKLKEGRMTVAVMGRACVGKTAILNQYIHKMFSDRYVVTVGDKHEKVVNVDGRQIEVEIMDTPGGYCFEYGRRQAIINADVFVLVYSVEEILSFQRVLELRESIFEKRGKEVPMVMVQTKTDIRKDKWFKDCESLHGLIPDGLQHPHFQVSAQGGSDMSVIFEEVVRLKLSDAKQPVKERRCSSLERIQRVLKGQQIWF